MRQIRKLRSMWQELETKCKNIYAPVPDPTLHLCIDDNIYHLQSFGDLRKKALNLLDKKEIESVCLFLREQKRSI